MRQEVKYYKGKEIPNDIYDRINCIGNSRDSQNSECEDLTSKEEICSLYRIKPSQINIFLGEDWYIIYSKTKRCLEILEWYGVERVDNKFMQTIEMMKALKEILLSARNRKIIADMKLSTSYKFYQLFLNKGYFKESYSFKGFAEDKRENIEDLFLKIKPKYETIEDYLNDESREIYPEYEEYFYCEACFTTTETFKKRYKKKNEVRNSTK